MGGSGHKKTRKRVAPIPTPPPAPIEPYYIYLPKNKMLLAENFGLISKNGAHGSKTTFSDFKVLWKAASFDVNSAEGCRWRVEPPKSQPAPHLRGFTFTIHGPHGDRRNMIDQVTAREIGKTIIELLNQKFGADNWEVKERGT